MQKYAAWLAGWGLACSFAENVAAADLAYGEYLAGECVACRRVGAEGDAWHDSITSDIFG
ncbi:MAG: hypothetical protein HC869_18800 [Rhodospirillales bacterium]|nr:hypothetical protein [Rhodospirillales bacterium]